jgi:hypothetical protein
MPTAESRLQLAEHLAISMFVTGEMGPLEMPAARER